MEKIVNYRLAIISDIHTGQQRYRGFFPAILDQIVALDVKPDALLLLGDLTQNGTAHETREVARNVRALEALGIVAFALVGNHDHWGGEGQVEENKQIMRNEGHAKILDGNAYLLKKEGAQLGIVGTEGFGTDADGGDRARNDMSPRSGKKVVDEEIAKMQQALDQVNKLNPNSHKVVMAMHYAPDDRLKIEGGEILPQLGTLVGEPNAITSKMGSRRFGEMAERQNATSPNKIVAILHGHADSGSAVGVIEGKIPVYNVSMKAAFRQNRQLYRILDIPTTIRV